MNCGTGSNCACSGTSEVQTNSRPTATTAGQPAGSGGQTYRPPANVVETADRYQITLEVPGSSPDGIDVQVYEGVLSVTAKVAPRESGAGRPLIREFGIGDYRREFRVGEDIDGGAITAAFAAGVLTINLPKSRKAEGRRVPVMAS